MGDAPLAYAETTGGVKVAEDDLVAVGKNDVSYIGMVEVFHLLIEAVGLVVQGGKMSQLCDAYIKGGVMWTISSNYKIRGRGYAGTSSASEAECRKHSHGICSYANCANAHIKKPVVILVRYCAFHTQ